MSGHVEQSLDLGIDEEALVHARGDIHAMLLERCNPGTPLGDLLEPEQDVILAGSAFPTDEGGRILVNYRGPAKTFLHLPAIDVLRGEIPSEVLAGRIALVGATEIGIGDIRTTPYGRVFPGVEIHANVIDNLLSGEVLRKDSDLELIEIGLILGLGLIMSLGVPLLGSASRGALLAVTVFGLLVASTVLAFNRDGLWINLAYPGLTVLLVYIVVAVAQSVTVARSRRQLRRGRGELLTLVGPVDQPPQPLGKRLRLRRH